MVNTQTKIAPLSRLEGLIMGVLWERGDSTAKEVRESLEATKPMAHTTVLTILSRLEEKGYIKQIPSLGRSLLFRSIVSKEKVARTSVMELLTRFFGGSPEKLIEHLVEEADITTRDLEGIWRRLEGAKSSVS